MDISANTSIDPARRAITLRQRPSARTVLTGLLSVVLVAAIGVVGIKAEPARPLGIVLSAVLLAVVMGWQWHEGRAAGRRPWGKASTVMQWVSILCVTFPASQLIWPAANNVDMYAWVASLVCAAGFTGFLTERWRS